MQRRPWAAAIAGAAVLLALAAPVTRPAARLPRRGQRPRDDHDAPGLRPRRRGLRPGRERPAAARRAEADGPATGRADRAGRDAARRARRRRGRRRRRQRRGRRRRAHRRRPRTSPQDAATEDLVRPPARRRRCPSAGCRSSVGGATAAFVDQSDVDRGPAAAVHRRRRRSSSFLLLLVAFRAVMVAIKAGLMNLLSIGAAYGVVALPRRGRLGRAARRASTPRPRCRRSSP